MCSSKTCATCKWGHKKKTLIANKPYVYCECRLKAPAVSPDDSSPWWPEVKLDDWCGEWESSKNIASNETMTPFTPVPPIWKEKQTK